MVSAAADGQAASQTATRDKSKGSRMGGPARGFRECGQGFSPETAAAPATVGGKFRHHPSHWPVRAVREGDAEAFDPRARKPVFRRYARRAGCPGGCSVGAFVPADDPAPEAGA